MSQSLEDEDRISRESRTFQRRIELSTVQTCSVKYNKEFCVIPDEVSLSFLRASRSRVRVRGMSVSRKNGSSPLSANIVDSSKICVRQWLTYRPAVQIIFIEIHKIRWFRWIIQLHVISSRVSVGTLIQTAAYTAFDEHDYVDVGKAIRN